MYIEEGKIGRIGDTTEVIDAYVASMHDSLGPTELAFTQKRNLDKEDQKKDQDYVHLLNNRISELQILPSIRNIYRPDTERSLSEYLTWKNLTKALHFEEVLQGGSGEDGRGEFTFRESAVSFLVELGEKSRSRTIATGLMGSLCNDGFVCFGDKNLTAFFSGDETKPVIPEDLEVILVKDGARMIPVIFDRKDMGKIDGSSADKILKTIHCDNYHAATLVISPYLYTPDGILALREKKIPFLAPVHTRDIEEQREIRDFFDDIVSPEKMQVFADTPIFAKKGRFAIKGDEIDGYGYFNPRMAPKEYKTYFKKLEKFRKVFERATKAMPADSDVFIRDIAKGDSRYFSGTKKDTFLEIGFNPDTILQRQKLLGTVFLYHFGTWNALDCYRHFEIWKMTGECFNNYRRIITSDDALQRGRALLSLINTAVRIGII
jgi:hypothetical protein